MPDEARQPSMFIEMVPIHTKLLALADERKVFPSCLSAHMQKGIFIFTEKSPVLKPWNNSPWFQETTLMGIGRMIYLCKAICLIGYKRGEYGN